MRWPSPKCNGKGAKTGWESCSAETEVTAHGVLSAEHLEEDGRVVDNDAADPLSGDVGRRTTTATREWTWHLLCISPFGFDACHDSMPKLQRKHQGHLCAAEA